MTDPDQHHEPRGPDDQPERTARYGPRPDSAGESTQEGPSPDQSAARYTDPETALGGADAIEKTTYVTGRGTEPMGQAKHVSAQAPSGAGVNITAWVVGIIVVLIALVYLVGLFR